MYSSVLVASLGDLTCLFADLFSDACIIAKNIPPGSRGGAASRPRSSWLSVFFRLILIVVMVTFGGSSSLQLGEVV